MFEEISIRTIFIISFVSVALITPVFAYVSYINIQNTRVSSQSIIQNSERIADLSENTVNTSYNVVTNIETIGEKLEVAEVVEANEEAEKLSENFQELYGLTSELIEYMNESENEFDQEINEIKSSREEIKNLVQYSLSSASQGVSLGTFVIEDSRDQLNNIARTSSKISSKAVNMETNQLNRLNDQLLHLSSVIFFAGIIIVVLSFGIAIAISLLISRPILHLERETDKIKKEKFNEVELANLKTRVKEFNDFKNVLEDVVIVLKSEFSRDREGKNDLAIGLIDILSQEVPRGVAESTVESSASRLGLDLLKLDTEGAKKIISNLRVVSKGLNIDEEIFEEMDYVVNNM